MGHGKNIKGPELQGNHRKKGHSGENNPMEHEKGTVTELWYNAVLLFPNIVEKHGEFSSQLFLAMLGMPLQLEKSLSTTSRSEAEGASQGIISNSKEKSSSDDVMLQVEEEKQEPLLQTVHEDAEIYSTTLPGKMGCPSNTLLTTKTELILDVGRSRQLVETHRNSSSRFALDEQSLNIENQEASADTNFMLIDPDAPLICDMRRCERLLLPHLPRLAVVDVVLTEFDLVYLDVNDSFAMNDGQKEIRKAIIATNGGKNLPLRVVLLGRKILGHAEVQNILSVSMQRYSTVAVSKVMAEDMAKTSFWLFFQSEYWIESVQGEVPKPDRAAQKGHKEQQQLQITLPEGVLSLRFFCDLVEHAEEAFAPTQERTSEASVWCRALTRFLVPTSKTPES